MPYASLVDPETRTLLPLSDLKERLDAAGLDLTRPVTTTCGSGITAALLALALHLVGHKDVALYDGSWSEWGLPGETPVDRDV
jgi:thiosulfate/3-mercaptopyruvate sulfurtransferase